MSLLRKTAKTFFALGDLFLARPMGARILIYHEVGGTARRQMKVTLRDFQRQIGWLVANRNVVQFETALDRWGDPDSDKVTVLTFDDGYRNVFANAFPILEALGLPFLIYVTTSLIEMGADRSREGGSEPLTWTDLERMVDSGLATIGAHTHTHKDLRVASEDEITEELGTSNALIARRLGITPRHFAYPYGYWSPVAEPLVRSRYESAVVGGFSNAGSRLDRMRIHRYPIQLADGMTFFKARVRGGLQFEERVRRGIRGYRGP